MPNDVVLEVNIDSLRTFYPEFTVEAYPDERVQIYLDVMCRIFKAYDRYPEGALAGAAHLLWVRVSDPGPEMNLPPDGGRGTVVKFSASDLVYEAVTQASSGRVWYAYWARTKYGREYVEIVEAARRANMTVFA